MKLLLLYGLTLYSFILVSRRIVINSYPLCRNGGRSTWGSRQTTVVRLRSLQESGSNEKQQTLFTLPSSPAAREEIVSLVQGWALSEAEEGPAVQVEVTDNGVIFGFKASQKSYLALDVISSDDNTVRINSRSVVEIDEDNPSLSSLIGMVARNLIDSLCHDIGDTVIEQPLRATDRMKEGKSNSEGDGFIEGGAESPRPSMCAKEIARASFEALLEHFSPIESIVASDIDAEYVATATDKLSTDIARGTGIGRHHTPWNGITVADWSHLAISQETVVTNFIRTWADQRFAGRGAGIEASDVPYGVKLNFAISDSYSVTLKVLCDYGGIDRIKRLFVVALLVHDGEDDNDYPKAGINHADSIDVLNEQPWSADSSAYDSEELKLVRMAIRNIVSALYSDLEALLLEPAASTSGNEAGMGMAGGEVEVIAGEKPRLGDLLGSSEAVQAILSANAEAASVKEEESADYMQEPDLKSLLKQQQAQRKKDNQGPSNDATPESPAMFGDSGVDNATGDGTSAKRSVEDGDGLDVQPSILSSKKGGGGQTQTSQARLEPEPRRQRDPTVVQKAASAGVKLENFEGKGLEQQALDELQRMMANSESEGFLTVLKTHKQQQEQQQQARAPMWQQKGRSDKREDVVEVNLDGDLRSLMEQGAALSQQAADKLEQELLRKKQEEGLDGSSRPGDDDEGEIAKERTPSSPANAATEFLSRPKPKFGEEDLSQRGTAFPMDLEGAGFAVRNPGTAPEDLNKANDIGPEGTDLIDIFAGPPSAAGQEHGVMPVAPSSVEGERLRQRQAELVPDLTTIQKDERSLELLVSELLRLPQERHADVLSAYKDVLLSDNLTFLLRRINDEEFDYETRQVYKKITDAAQTVLQELSALVGSESVRHLETIMQVCEIAAMYQHNEEEFLSRMEPLRPYFDTALLGYLSYAIQEEEIGLTNKGGDPHAMPSRWLNVLRLVQQGVLAEFETRFERLLEPLLLAVRFQQTEIRQAVFERFVNVTASVDLQYMRELAINMVEGGMKQAQAAGAKKVQMGKDSSEEEALYEDLRSFRKTCIEIYLSEEIVARRMAAFEAECAAQGKELVVRKRHPLMQAQLEEQESERRKRDLKSLAPTASSADSTHASPNEEWGVDLLGESILQPSSRERDDL